MTLFRLGRAAAAVLLMAAVALPAATLSMPTSASAAGSLTMLGADVSSAAAGR